MKENTHITGVTQSSSCNFNFRMSAGNFVGDLNAVRCLNFVCITITQPHLAGSMLQAEDFITYCSRQKNLLVEKAFLQMKCEGNFLFTEHASTPEHNKRAWAGNNARRLII